VGQQALHHWVRRLVLQAAQELAEAQQSADLHSQSLHLQEKQQQPTTTATTATAAITTPTTATTDDRENKYDTAAHLSATPDEAAGRNVTVGNIQHAPKH
jgi:hypothetical protein